MLDGVWWEIYKPVSLFLGLGALIALLLNRENRGWRKLLLWGGLGLLSSSVLLSMVFEDLLPTLSTLPEERRLTYALSFPVILLGVFVICYGGWRFVRATFGAMGLEAASPRKARRVNRRVPPRAEAARPAGSPRGEAHGGGGGRTAVLLLSLWWWPLAWMAAGFFLLFFGASLKHENHFPLGWLWAFFGA